VERLWTRSLSPTHLDCRRDTGHSPASVINRGGVTFCRYNQIEKFEHDQKEMTMLTV